jgi:prolyl oligopeptidase
MHPCLNLPPHSEQEPVTEILHGVPVTDPYRWLEDQDSPRTRVWIEEQTRYARHYLDSIPGRDHIRERIREFLAVETYDSLQKAGNRYFFRKRLPDQEQGSIYVRDGLNGNDRVLIDPAARGTGKYTSVKPLRVSPDRQLLLYEVKEGGERTGTFELLDIETLVKLPDILPRGLLRGFVFAPDSRSFYYVHEPVAPACPPRNAVYHHVLGTPLSEDREVFCLAAHPELRLFLFRGEKCFGIFVQRLCEKTYTDFYIYSFAEGSRPEPVVLNVHYVFEPILVNDQIFAMTDRHAPNLKIVEVCSRGDAEPIFREIVPETDVPIRQWAVARRRIFVSYVKQTRTAVRVHDFSGELVQELPVEEGETVRLIGPVCSEELCVESESFTQPVTIWRYDSRTNNRTLWAKRNAPFDPANYRQEHVWYTSKDGTCIPMFLVGRDRVRRASPTIMTSYGGYGLSMTPRFSVLTAILIEYGCVFALPNIRGGSEFGIEWHNSAKRRNRQKAYDDFLCAAEFLIETGRTTPAQLAIFGGSNSGLLVGAALTQRPDLFRAAVCIAPLLDMLRYHLFDDARAWKEEFGTSADPDDFAALANYSPYHQVKNSVSYPGTLIVSGDADTNCNALHARKMAARLQEANASPYPILLDYSPYRGHSPVLPLSERVRALTDRVAFLFDQLQLEV